MHHTSEWVEINWECASFGLAGPSEQTLPTLKVPGTAFSLPH